MGPWGPVIPLKEGPYLAGGDKLTKVAVERTFERLQIDHLELLSRCPLALPFRRSDRAVAPSPRLACFLRKDPKSGRLTTPQWFVEALLELPNADVTWFGLGSRQDYEEARVGEAPHVAYAGDSYSAQLLKLTEFDAAVGFNSGGLDLASAAGLPVLRLAEYQRDGEGMTRATKRRKRWGAKLNSFLARRTNIGLPPN